MSGGSLDYAFRHIVDLADSIESRGNLTIEQRAFAAHLRLVAKAAHDLEWVWSSDYAKGAENPAILAVVSQGLVLDTAIARAKAAHADLGRAIQAANPQPKGKLAWVAEADERQAEAPETPWPDWPPSGRRE